MGSELDYVTVLKALRDIPFGVGKKLLINFLQGKKSPESITRNNLDKLESFGSLAYETSEIEGMINNLIMNKLINQASIKGNRFWKVLELSKLGIEEIGNPSLFKLKTAYKKNTKTTEITEEDRNIFAAFSTFLEKYNDEQKKAIICNKDKILCIAGAGSGKTTVLTKKIEFLIKYQSIDPKKILAITFTRKARLEMMHRLENIGDLSIETFNSFCEKILKKHNDEIYDRKVSMISYRDKILIVRKALTSLGTSMDKAINKYFSYSQRRGKTKEQLANIFLNDCFFIRDYLKVNAESANKLDLSDSAALLVYGVGNYIESYMKKTGLRDFTDQIIDAISLFKSKGHLIPQYEYVLIDEYQDINSSQIELIDLINPKSLFCVGDPRQSIFGWRGSKIKYILDFEEKYPDSEAIILTKNYRSSKKVVDIINKSIAGMGFSDLEPTISSEDDVELLKFSSEDSEADFIIRKIESADVPREEIFVLARTNRLLNDMSKKLKASRIKHVLKSDEINRSVTAKKGEVTLATIHAIKGLEAEMVFVIGCTSINFPCRGSEHPVIDMLKVNEYDKEEEEKRLFYVAMSRAKNKLTLTYPGKSHTHFISKEMLDMINKTESKARVKINKKLNLNDELFDRLKLWRKKLSSDLGVPPYVIMHDKTLIDISQKKPLLKEDLEEIHGIGPAKIMKYGEEILDIVNFK